ncbi:MAG: ATP-binding protein [Chthoniobacteraceae bacterium]
MSLALQTEVPEERASEWYVSAMERLIFVVQELSLARSLESIMAIVRHAARELTGADGATFVLRDHGFCYYADEEAIAPLWKGKRFPLQTCISGWAMLNRQSVVIENIFEDPRIPHEAYRPTFVKSLAMVPIRSLDPVGGIGAYWASHRQPRPEEIRILEALANCTSVAMENVQLYAGLEQKVAERTARLQMLNEELDSFTHTVSHDLRAPLRHIEGFAQLLAQHDEKGLSEKGIGYLHTISSSARSMNQLITDLLDFSRMGRSELLHTPVDMNQLVAQVWEELAPERNDREITWLPDSLPTIEGDSAMLRQVWINLLSNAIKYTSQRPQAEIRVGVVPGNGEIEFFVADNGAGFDMHYAGKLFGVFQRLHRQEEFDGTGIGLANVRRIINRHGGRIWAEAEVDRGATFRFTLPVS